MKIAIIGASGQAGSRIVAEALRRGHTVTGIARNPRSIAEQPNLRSVAGDARDARALAPLLTGHDAVVSAVRFVDSDPRVLIDAVRRSGVKRYVVVGGAGSLIAANGEMLINAPGFPAVARAEAAAGKIFLDALEMAGGDLDWTFLCPSASFVAGERTGTFRVGADHLLADAAGKSWISFEDYAVALLDELEHPAHVRRRFTVGY